MKPAGFVLAGGHSRRMGRDKALLPYAGATLVEHALSVLRTVCGEVAIAGDREDLAQYARVIPDVFADCGPLGGIHAALAQSRQEWNIFLAVDLPCIGAEDLIRLVDERGELGAAAYGDGRLQPLCGIYHRRLAEPIAQALAAGERAVIPVLTAACAAEGAGLVKVELAEAAALANLNTPDDLTLWTGRPESFFRS